MSSQSIPETQNIVIIICVYIEIKYFCNIFLISKFYSQFVVILQSVLIFLMQSFQNMTQEVAHFELGWLGDEEDKWITSSIQSEFMKEFKVKPQCTNNNIELWNDNIEN